MKFLNKNLLFLTLIAVSSVSLFAEPIRVQNNSKEHTITFSRVIGQQSTKVLDLGPKKDQSFDYDFEARPALVLKLQASKDGQNVNSSKTFEVTKKQHGMGSIPAALEADYSDTFLTGGYKLKGNQALKVKTFKSYQ